MAKKSVKQIETIELEGELLNSVSYAVYYCRLPLFTSFRIFNRAEEIVKTKIPDVCAHISASGGILRGGGFLKDGARAGITLYGYAPAGFSRAEFEPTLKVYARRTQITPFIGGGVGYNFADRNYKNFTDDALYLENVPEDRQPGLFVRRVHGKTLNDEEMLKYYTDLVKQYGTDGKLNCKWVYGLAVIADNGKENTYTWLKDNFYMVQTISGKIHPGYPLNSISKYKIISRSLSFHYFF